MINAASLQMVMGGYIYYLSKFLELFDTIFFVMRKRFDQVSTLHVIHHGIMPFASESKLEKFQFYLNSFIFYGRLVRYNGKFQVVLERV